MVTRSVQGRLSKRTYIRAIFLGGIGIPIASLISFAAAQFSYVVVDSNQIPNGHKPKVIGDFDNSGTAGIGAMSVGQGFKLYRYPDWAPQLIASDINGSDYEDAQAVDVDGDGALDIVIGGLGGNTYWLQNPLYQGRDPYKSAWNVHQIQSGRSSHDVVVGDINRDGRMDVATDSGIYLQGNTPDDWTFVGAPQINRSLEGTTIANLLNDGYLDVIAPYQDGTELAWFENPLHNGGNPATDIWTVHIIDANPSFSGEMTSAATDFNGDGRLDVVMAPMYLDGTLCWYEAPADPRNQTWIKHVIGSTNYVHQGSLQIADFDGDGSPDIAFAEQEQSASKRIGIFYNTGGGASWDLQVMANSGGHNLKAGIIGRDHLASLLSANHGFYGAPNPLELWRNLQGPGRSGGSGGLLSGVGAPAASDYDLTGLGASDWAHWGRGGDYKSFDHQANGQNQISNVSPAGSGGNYGWWSTPSRAVSWQDGDPTSSASGETGYIWGNGAVGSGFSFTVPADDQVIRRLEIYCGGYGTQGTLTASLSDGSAPDWVTQDSGAGLYTNLYTITYKAGSAGQTLQITYLKTANVTGTDGSVDLKWAALW